MRPLKLTLPLTLLLAFVCSACFAAYPYDSVAELMVKHGNHYNGGSGTLIAVSETQGLILTCKHVVEATGNTVKIHWSATGEISTGKVIKVGRNQDIALIVCPRPKGIRPVPVVLPITNRSGPITNAGYPGVKGVIEWQQGNIRSLTDTQLFYTCRPIPGMSGGATFDRHGNLVGVITHYQNNGGISSSGVEMIRFILDQGSSAITWDYPDVEQTSYIGHGDPTTLIPPQEDYEVFQFYIYLRYTGPLSNHWSTPLVDYKEELAA